MRSTFVACSLLSLVSPLAAQAFPQNKLEVHNWWVADREDPFPNFATGNVFGDGLFKVIPSTLLERGGDHLISGYQLCISIDDAFTGMFPVVAFLPGVQVFRTEPQTINGAAYEVLDHDRPVGPQFDPIFLPLSADQAWAVEISFDPASFNPKLRNLLTVPALENGQRQGLAIMALADPGRMQSPNVANVVLQASYQERHFPPGAPSYSGSYDATTGAVRMYGTTGQPSATGELYASLRFANPTLQIFSDAAGGLSPDPDGYETHMGTGAYCTDFGTRVGPAWFGFFMQATQYAPATGGPTHMMLPLVVSMSAAGPTTSLRIGNATLRVNPAELQLADLFVQAGFGGPLGTYTASGVAGFDEDQRGVSASQRFTVPANPALQGMVLWLQGLVVDAKMQPVDSTNVVRWTFQ